MGNNRRAFQDDLDQNYCWGCGIANPHGLHIKSTWSGDAAVCVWQPAPEHMAGPRGVLNGGIIATIIDCHSICTAVADAYRAEGRRIGTDPMIWYVTGSLAVSYRRPAPLDHPLRVSARIRERSGRKTIVVASVSAGEEECATGEVIAVRVAPEWFAAYDRPEGVGGAGIDESSAVGRLPAAVFAALDQTTDDTGPTVVVATTDADGAAHMAPFGSLCALTPRTLRFGCDRRHDTFANLRRDARVVVSLVAPPDIAVSIRGRARVVRERMVTAPTDAIVEITVEEVKNDFVPGGIIAAGISLQYADPLREFVRTYKAEVRARNGLKTLSPPES